MDICIRRTHFLALSSCLILKLRQQQVGKIIYLVLCLIVWNCLFWTLLKEAPVASATCDRNNMIQIVRMDIKSKRFEWTSCNKPLLLLNGFAYEKQTLAQPNLHLEVQHCYSCDKEHLKSLSQEETGQNWFLIIQDLCYSWFDSLLRAYTLIYHSYFLFMKIDHLYGSI